jgi:hypothetical protein
VAARIGTGGLGGICFSPEQEVSNKQTIRRTARVAGAGYERSESRRKLLRLNPILTIVTIAHLDIYKGCEPEHGWGQAGNRMSLYTVIILTIFSEIQNNKYFNF